MLLIFVFIFTAGMISTVAAADNSSMSGSSLCNTDKNITTQFTNNTQINTTVNQLQCNNISKNDPRVLHKNGTWDPISYTTIQDAIDAVTTVNGDTIQVGSGTYTENIYIYKALTLKAVGNVIITPESQDTSVIYIDSSGSGTTINGFKITGANSSTAIYLDNASKCFILNNTIMDTGQYESGIEAHDPYNITIANNTLKNIDEVFLNYNGNLDSVNAYCIISNNTLINSSLDLSGVNDNQVLNNYLSNGSISLFKSFGNTFKNNKMINGTLELDVWENNVSAYVKGYVNNIDTTNTINGKPIYYLINQKNVTISNIQISSLYLISCNNILIKNVNITGYNQGMLLLNTTKSQIINCKISNSSDIGIYLLYSLNNTLTGNTLSNDYGGITLQNSLYNNITKNILTNGTMYITNSPKNIFRNNTINYSDGSTLIISGDNISAYINDIDTTNTINSLPIYYLMNQNNITINNIRTSYLGLINCNNILIKNVNITGRANLGAILLVNTTNSKIINCTMQYQLLGINLFYSSNNTVTGNSLTHNQEGIELDNSPNNKLLENIINYSEDGIVLDNSPNNNLLENIITNCEASINLNGNFNNTIIQFNRIVNNYYGLSTSGSGMVNATLNWWGYNNATNVSSQIYKDSSSNGIITYNPWIISSISAKPITVTANGLSTITVDLLHDNKGVYHNPANGVIPYSTLVYFNATLGTINNTVMTNGVTQSTFKAGKVHGVANISAKIDTQTIKTIITIDTTPPTITINPQGGLYNTTQKVNLTTTDPDSTTITYYTTDGSNPQNSTTRSTYSTPISITKSVTLKYSAVDPAGNWSPIYNQTYTIDTTPPTITKIDPANNTTINNTSKVITITFSEPIKIGSTYNNIKVTNSGGIKVSILSNITGNTLTLTCSSGSYNNGTTYTINIPTNAVTDKAGNNLTKTYTSNFTVKTS